MSTARLPEVQLHYPPATSSDWLKLARQLFEAYSPLLRQRPFWVIVILVASISTAHTLLETAVHLPFFVLFYFVPSALFLIPAVYAAVTFGLRGALVTSLAATALTVPNWILFHPRWQLFGCMSQLLVVNITAYVIGQQVDRVKSARQRAEATSAALTTSETKYRGLFESNPIALLILDSSGIIQDANPAAGILFNRRLDTLKGVAVADILGTVNAKKLLGYSRTSQQPEPLVLAPEDELELYIEPKLTEADDGHGNAIIQALLRDVTEEQHRQAGLRAYAAHVLRIQEEERQRIARELHDGAIQQLALLHRQLSGLQDSPNALPPPLVDSLQTAKDTTEEVVKGLRDFTRALRPPILDDLGLVIATRRLLSDLAERTGLKAQMKVAGKQRRLLSDTELGIFRIAQEALRNVERHARATQLTVSMTFAAHEFCLEVDDNGIGFVISPSSSDFTASGQTGLINLQERAKLLNGKLEIQSNPGNGTRVNVSVPI